MLNTVKKDELLAQYAENIKICIERVQMCTSLESAIEAGNVKGAKYALEQVLNAFVVAVPQGYELPKVTMYNTFSENENGNIAIVGITLSNNYRSDYKFSFKETFPVRGNIEETLISYMGSVFETLFIDVLAKENVALVNEVMEEVTSKAELEYKVSFVTSMTYEGKKIASISNDEVVFVADSDRIFRIDEFMLFAELSEERAVTEEKKADAMEKTVAKFAQAQTTVEFVDLHEVNVGFIANIGKMVKAFTLIKKTVSKNITHLRGNKDTLAYYRDGDTYAILSVTEDGKAVILNPFNVNTLEPVDIDVLKEI